MNAPLHVATWEPKTGQTHGIVLLLHGAESHSGWFDAVGQSLAAGGLKALAFDRTGWGLSGGRRGSLKSAAQVLAEVKTEAQRHGAPLHLAGLSWGGLLAAAAAAKFPQFFQSVTLIAPSLFRRKTPGLASIVRAGLGLGLVKLPIQPEDFTSKSEQLAFVKNDRLRVERVNFGFLLATVSLEKIARDRVATGPARILLAATDALIDNDKTTAWAKTHGFACRTIPDTRHSLVLEDPKTVAREILDVTRGP